MFGRDLEAREDDFLYAVDLFNAGYFWEAHVYWERLWTVASESDEREFLRGLIQLAAALVKQRQGLVTGRDKLVGKALSRLRRVERPAVMGVRLSELIEAVEAGGGLEIELRA